jgi:hypothetical protein
MTTQYLKTESTTLTLEALVVISEREESLITISRESGMMTGLVSMRFQYIM